MAAAGLLVYVLESRPDRQRPQPADRPGDRRAPGAAGGRRPADRRAVRQRASGCSTLYLDRNVTDDDEMLVTLRRRRGPQAHAQPVRGGDPRRAGLPGRRRRGCSRTGGTEVDRQPRVRRGVGDRGAGRERRDPGNTGALVDHQLRRRRAQRAQPHDPDVRRASRCCFLGLITLLAIWRSGQLLAPLTDAAHVPPRRSARPTCRLRIPERGQRRHHRARPAPSTTCWPGSSTPSSASGSSSTTPATSSRRRSRSCGPPRAARRRRPATRSPRPGSCCSTRSTGCRAWSAT